MNVHYPIRKAAVYWWTIVEPVVHHCVRDQKGTAPEDLFHFDLERNRPVFPNAFRDKCYTKFILTIMYAYTSKRITN